jgi:hypothetical protein
VQIACTMSDKKIIFRSIWYYVGLATISWAFSIQALLSWLKQSSMLYGFSMAFFGSCALFLTYRLISPKYKFISTKSQEFQDYIAKQAEEKNNDLGIFTYDNDQFIFEKEGEIKSYNWNNIKIVLAYKEDRSTYDIIMQTIIMDDGFVLSLNEDIAGWFQFQKRLAQQLPQISIDWLIHIANPPFQKNTTLLYNKENKSLEEALKEITV